jgi:hypothetical protein
MFKLCILLFALLFTGQLGAFSGTVTLEHTEGRGLGYQQGYSTLGLFVSESFQDEYFPFLDLREHLFNNGREAFNIGAGVRINSNFLPGVLGFNGYYDYLKSVRHGLHQVGCGIEYLSDLFDIRLNGYIPVGYRRNVISVHHFTYPGGYYAICYPYKEALGGGDGEVGLSLYRSCWLQLYGALGPYYYHRPTERDFCGGRARLVLELGKYLSLEARATHDRVYKSRVQGVISFIMPFAACGCDECFINQPVKRNEIITLNTLNCSWKTNY